jgi:polar amino acid transport system substrate-binding protein
MTRLTCHRPPGAVALAVALVLVLLSDPFTVPAHAAGQVARLTTGEWAPYVGRDLPEHGLCARIVAAVLHEMGRQPEFLFLPWVQAQAEAERSGQDRLQGTFPYIRTPQRERLFYFSEPLFTTETVVFYSATHHPDLAGASEAADLAGLTAVISSGYAYPDELEAVMIATVEEPHEVRAFQRLIEDPAVHYLAAARRVGEEVLARSFPARGFELRVVEGLSWQRDLHLMASRRNPRSWQFVQDFDAALARVRQSGVFDRIVSEQSGASLRPEVVELIAAVGQDIAATSAQAPGAHLLLPVGVRAVVLEWGAAYRAQAAGEVDAGQRLCRVRLLSGPARGEVVMVDGRHLRLLKEDDQ